MERRRPARGIWPWLGALLLLALAACAPQSIPTQPPTATPAPATPTPPPTPTPTEPPVEIATAQVPATSKATQQTTPQATPQPATPEAKNDAASTEVDFAQLSTPEADPYATLLEWVKEGKTTEVDIEFNYFKDRDELTFYDFKKGVEYYLAYLLEQVGFTEALQPGQEYHAIIKAQLFFVAKNSWQIGRFPVWLYGVITRDGDEIKLEVEPLDEQTAKALDLMWVGNQGYWAELGPAGLLGSKSKYVTYANKEGIQFYFFVPQEEESSAAGLPVLVIKADREVTGKRYLARYHLEASYQIRDASSLPADVTVYFEK